MQFKRLRADEVQAGAAIEYEISRGLTAIGEVLAASPYSLSLEPHIQFKIHDPVRPTEPVYKLIPINTVLNTWHK